MQASAAGSQGAGKQTSAALQTRPPLQSSSPKHPAAAMQAAVPSAWTSQVSPAPQRTTAQGSVVGSRGWQVPWGAKAGRQPAGSAQGSSKAHCSSGLQSKSEEQVVAMVTQVPVSTGSQGKHSVLPAASTTQGSSQPLACSSQT